MKAIDLEVGIFVEVYILQIQFKEYKYCVRLVFRDFCVVFRVPVAIVYKPIRKTRKTPIYSHDQSWRIAKLELFRIKY
jgi:hypothetical protein